MRDISRALWMSSIMAFEGLRKNMEMENMEKYRTEYGKIQNSQTNQFPTTAANLYLSWDR